MVLLKPSGRRDRRLDHDYLCHRVMESGCGIMSTAGGCRRRCAVTETDAFVSSLPTIIPLSVSLPPMMLCLDFWVGGYYRTSRMS